MTWLIDPLFFGYVKLSEKNTKHLYEYCPCRVESL